MKTITKMSQTQICLNLNQRLILTKSNNSQTLLYTPRTAILLENYLHGLNNLVYLSTTFFIERFFNVFKVSSWCQRFLHLYV